MFDGNKMAHRKFNFQTWLYGKLSLAGSLANENFIREYKQDANQTTQCQPG
jgi:hypothetical protein